MGVYARMYMRVWERERKTVHVCIGTYTCMVAWAYALHGFDNVNYWYWSIVWSSYVSNCDLRWHWYFTHTPWDFRDVKFVGTYILNYIKCITVYNFFLVQLRIALNVLSVFRNVLKCNRKNEKELNETNHTSWSSLLLIFFFIPVLFCSDSTENKLEHF